MDAITVYANTSGSISDLRQRIWEDFQAHLTKFRFPYVAFSLLLACMLYYLPNSGPRLCMVNWFQSGKPVLSNVYPSPMHIFSNAPELRRVQIIVPGHVIHITYDEYRTRIEVGKWGRNGAAGGSYAELPFEVFCENTDFCPPITSSGDYIGIPTNNTLTSRVMYTIFLVPALEERARGCVFVNSTEYACIARVETLWGEVIQRFCGPLFTILLVAVVVLAVVLTEAVKLCAHTSRYSLPVQQNPMQGLLPGPLNDQAHQGVGSAPSTSDGCDVVGDSDSPPLQYSTDADTSSLMSVPDDLRSSCHSLVSTKSEKGGSGNSRMVCPHHNLGASSSSGSSSDENVTGDSSSDDNSYPPSNIQEESTTDVPPPHYARHRILAVYETLPGNSTVPRPPPEGSGCSS